MEIVQATVFSASLYDDKGCWGLPHFLLEFRRLFCGLTSAPRHRRISAEIHSQTKNKSQKKEEPNFPLILSSCAEIVAALFLAAFVFFHISYSNIGLVFLGRGSNSTQKGAAQ